VGPRAVLDGCENLAPTGIRFSDCPSLNESRYRLSYPGPLMGSHIVYISLFIGRYNVNMYVKAVISA
jgi:hypothetical protein